MKRKRGETGTPQAPAEWLEPGRWWLGSDVRDALGMEAGSLGLLRATAEERATCKWALAYNTSDASKPAWGPCQPHKRGDWGWERAAVVIRVPAKTRYAYGMGVRYWFADRAAVQALGVAVALHDAQARLYGAHEINLQLTVKHAMADRKRAWLAWKRRWGEEAP